MARRKTSSKRVVGTSRRNYERIVVVGSVGFDSIMELPGRFGDYIMADSIDQLNVSFTVETLRREFGGTGGNCAYGLGLLKQKPMLVSAWGQDSEAYQAHLQAVQVDLSHVLVDETIFSATGHVMTDADHNQMWMFYPGALKRMVEINLQHLVRKTKDLVLLMPSQPTVFAKHLREAVEFGVDFIFDPAFFIPNLSGKELMLGISHAKIVFGNDYEIGLIEKKTNTVVEDWIRGGVIIVRTLGKHGSYIWQAGNVWEVPVVKPESVADPTGAGDAYRAGFLAGYLQGLDLETCGRMGALISAYKVEKPGTQTYGFSVSEFKKRYKKAFGVDLAFSTR